MTTVDRWLLPEGVEEVLPAQANAVEILRRRILDLYDSWGYQFVIPPLIEFTESLLIGIGSDVDLHSFKVTDQLSGRMMAVRADITPQVARIDAHSLKLQGPVRLCYAGSVLHTRPKALMASRSPIQVGAELYGDASLASDIEIICLMLETLDAVGVRQVTLDLGHVGIYRALVELAGLEEEAEKVLFDALQRKALPEIDALIDQHIGDRSLADMFRQLPRLNGDVRVLDKARKQLAKAPADVHAAVDMLVTVADQVSRRAPAATLYFDLSELRGYHYHTGLVFAAYAPGYGQAIANGGRYDHIGEVFGRARPATGFNTDLKALINLPQRTRVEGDTRINTGIFAPAVDDPGLWQTVQRLRGEGERVVCGLADENPDASCDRQLVFQAGKWEIRQLDDD